MLRSRPALMFIAGRGRSALTVAGHEALAVIWFID
jgi:hypothetical protein